MRDVDRNDDHSGKGSGGGGSAEVIPEITISDSNFGTLIMDATVAGADIKYPTDIDLLNQRRGNIETAIDLLGPCVSHEQHKYLYNRKKARQSFLIISKFKSGLERSCVREQDYSSTTLKRQLSARVRCSSSYKFGKKNTYWLKDRLLVIPTDLSVPEGNVRKWNPSMRGQNCQFAAASCSSHCTREKAWSYGIWTEPSSLCGKRIYIYRPALLEHFQ